MDKYIILLNHVYYAGDFFFRIGVLAIEPLVQHVFLKYTVMASSTEIKELETQQDVLFTMLLRLLPHSRVSRA